MIDVVTSPKCQQVTVSIQKTIGIIRGSEKIIKLVDADYVSCLNLCI